MIIRPTSSVTALSNIVLALLLYDEVLTSKVCIARPLVARD